MIEVLQEFDFQVVHRPGEKDCISDALSWQTTREPEWQEDEEEAATRSGPQPTNFETVIANLREHGFYFFVRKVVFRKPENVDSVDL